MNSTSPDLKVCFTLLIGLLIALHKPSDCIYPIASDEQSGADVRTLVTNHAEENIPTSALLL